MSRALAPVFGLCALGALLAAARPAGAKEHDAGCAAIPSLRERVRNTLLLASVHRTRGSSLAAYQVLRINADLLLAEPSTGDCGALARFFKQALGRAARASTASEASMELDLGYAAALALAVAGRLPDDAIAAKVIDVPEAAQYGDDCPDLLAIVRRLEAPAPALKERAAAVLADLRAHPRCAQMRSLLDTRPDLLPAAVDAVVLDESPTSPAADNPIARCPELPVVLDRLSAAINVGAPLYNQGDHEGCRKLYDTTARTLTGKLIPPQRCPVIRRTLLAALTEAEAATTASEAAWALRRGFDKVSGSVDPAQ
jgi:hypothetical protein